jgi:AcrR family transcriptional regulator
MNLDSSERKKVRELRSRLRVQVADAILDAAEEVIAEKGMTGASMSAIAARAGIAVGTLYNYYRDRDAMVRALFKARQSDMVPGLAEAFEAGRGLAFAERVGRFVSDLLGLFDVRRRYVKVAIQAEHLKPKGGSGKSFITLLHEQIVELMEAGVAEGQIDAAHAQLQGRMLAAAVRAVIMLRIDGNLPFRDDAAVVTATFLHGAVKRA